MRQQAEKQSRRGRRGKGWLFAFALLCLAVVTVTKLWPREPLLLERSRRIAYFPGRSGDANPYWQSDNQCLLLTTPDSKEPLTKHIWQAEQIDGRTGEAIPVAWLTRIISDAGGDPYGFVPSPDGKWLLWMNVQTGDGGGVVIAASLTKQRGIVQDVKRRSQFYWVDNTHWAEDQRTRDDEHGIPVGEHRRLIVYNVEKPKEARLVREHSPQERQVQAQLEAHNPHQFVTGGDTACDNDFDPAQDEIVELLVGCQKARPLRRTRIILPQGTSLKQSVVSPSGKWVAYLLTRSRPTRFTGLLHRLFRSYDVPGGPDLGVWVGRVGGAAHEVGRLSDYREADLTSGLAHLQWLPGEKQLSFVHQEALWTVAVD